MQKITIDLNNLTPARLAECRPYMGECNYASPCVIGSLMTPMERTRVEAYSEDADDVRYFVEQGVFIIPPEQMEDAVDIQEYFDSHDWDSVLQIASKYMKEPVT